MSTGYHKVAEFMASHRDMAMCERFEYMNILNLLGLQAEIKGYEESVKEALGDLKQTMAEREPRQEHSQQAEQGMGATEMDITDAISMIDGRFSYGLRRRHRSDVGSKDDIVNDSATASESRSSIFSRSYNISSSNVNHDDRSTLPSIDPRRDWFFLKTMDSTLPVWQTMLSAREKLKEYNLMISLLKDTYAQPSPTLKSFNLCTKWFRDEDLGDGPLLGVDRNVYSGETSRTSLLALAPPDEPDPLSAFFSNVVLNIYHKVNIHLLERLKHSRSKSNLADLEIGHESRKVYYYNEGNFIRLANMVGSLISSSWLISSILILYFVKEMRARLAIIAAFTTTFSLILSLLTSARKAEVFAGTAA
ncbi:hypothetical protein GLAREA_09531 [Glarea lozoyensis ATCC 20868]|uniref:DUF6594 domain-containing protein n=1 Tax=Glarea lozoyensis (strain ATCC 20868 / MF5171) TaxID=1116229 RepID=S3D8T6_GLAL2|nr:uncharacterized protein GLAREA_09531 [Glarea lozoyensis ATCC 20868]EPE28411.1 hypothetical protein GLAREA_09531 [Glarea lozoyensis ATCC 20868]